MNIAHTKAKHLDTQKDVRFYLENSLSPNTKKALESDLRDFERRGYTLPSTPEQICTYLAELAQENKPSTINRKLASISKAHQMKGYENPTPTPIVQQVYKGIKRTQESAQKQAAPLLKEDLIHIISTLHNTPKDVRDSALLLIGFCGAFRRSELVALNREDIQLSQQGLTLHIRRSKTDSEGKGRKIAIPCGRGHTCPVKSLLTWLEIASIESGPIFKRINKGGNVSHERLSCRSVSNIIKSHVKRIGLAPESYSGHSLRAGLATSAAQHGISSYKIKQQTGHASDSMLFRYLRDGDMFTNNAAGIF